MTEIPVFQNQSADFTLNIDLDNINTEIRFIFNTRTETWFIWLRTINGELKGTKLVKNFPLLDNHKAIFSDLPGDFLVLQISDEITNPDLDYDSLGVFWALFYLTENEINVWKEENNI